MKTCEKLAMEVYTDLALATTLAFVRIDCSALMGRLSAVSALLTPFRFAANAAAKSKTKSVGRT